MKIVSKYLYLFILINAVILQSCGGAGGSVKSTTNRKTFRALSEAESKIYITPTIYYIPEFDVRNLSCGSDSIKEIKDRNGKVLFNVCSKMFDDCLMEGTCFIKSTSSESLVNVYKKINSEYRFSIVDSSVCRYGYGAGKKICLDPYHSVAADLSIYSLGQVIYIPDLVGVTLPDGSKHDGYFVIRDSGAAIKGFGRFDFFTGIKKSNKPEDVFSPIGLSDKNYHVHYFVVGSDKQAEILRLRNYPNLRD